MLLRQKIKVNCHQNKLNRNTRGYLKGKGRHAHNGRMATDFFYQILWYTDDLQPVLPS